jgi:hypothetical protein
VNDRQDMAPMVVVCSTSAGLADLGEVIYGAGIELPQFWFNCGNQNQADPE